MLAETKTTRKQFQKLFSTHLQLKRINDDTYYPIQTQLIADLREFIRRDFSVLTVNQILHLCAMVQTHRPESPHSFLMRCENLVTTAKPNY